MVNGAGRSAGVSINTHRGRDNARLPLEQVWHLPARWRWSGSAAVLLYAPRSTPARRIRRRLPKSCTKPAICQLLSGGGSGNRFKRVARCCSLFGEASASSFCRNNRLLSIIFYVCSATAGARWWGSGPAVAHLRMGGHQGSRAFSARSARGKRSSAR